MMFTALRRCRRMGCFELPLGTSVRQAYESLRRRRARGPQVQGAAARRPAARRSSRPAPSTSAWSRRTSARRQRGRPRRRRSRLPRRARLHHRPLHPVRDGSWKTSPAAAAPPATAAPSAWSRSCGVSRRAAAASPISRSSASLAATLRYSNCFHGQFAPSIIMNSLDSFMDEVNEHIFDRRCRAKFARV